MMSRQSTVLLAVPLGVALAVCTSTSMAQNVQTSVPFQSVGSSHASGATINWWLRGENWFAQFGGNGPLLPPFGGDPGGGLSTGFGFAGGGVSGGIGLNLAQSSSRSITSQTPSVTTMDGVPGSVSAGVVRPFVTGFTPVVGDYAGAVGPLNQAAQAADQLGQHQLNSLRQSQATLKHKKLDQYLRRAFQAEADGNKRMARANYRAAIAIAPQPLRYQLQQRLTAMMRKTDKK